MLTLCIAAAVLAACTALRWFLNRPERKDEAFWNGRIRLTAAMRDKYRDHVTREKIERANREKAARALAHIRALANY